MVHLFFCFGVSIISVISGHIDPTIPLKQPSSPSRSFVSKLWWQNCFNSNFTWLVSSFRHSQFIDCSLQFWVWHRRLGAEVVCHVSQEESNLSNLVLTPPLQSPLGMVFHKDQFLDYYFFFFNFFSKLFFSQKTTRHVFLLLLISNPYLIILRPATHNPRRNFLFPFS